MQFGRTWFPRGFCPAGFESTDDNEAGVQSRLFISVYYTCCHRVPIFVEVASAGVHVIPWHRI